MSPSDSVSDVQPTTNIEEALAFLRNRCPNGPWDLCSIFPDGPITARTFGPEAIDDLKQFLASRNGRENCYVHVNPLKLGVRNTKARKSNIAHADWLHVDIDDVEGLGRLQAFVLLPTAVVFSGGGYNVYWKLKEPLADLDAAERANRNLVEQLGGDPAATDVSRILRLPGTVNIPNKKKRERGRRTVAAYLVEELTDWRRAYDAAQFLALTAAPQTVVGLAATIEASVKVAAVGIGEFPDGIGERIRSLIIAGDDEERPRSGPSPRYRSRSEGVFAAACALVGHGLQAPEIAAILVNPAYRISESLLEKRDPAAEALRQAERAAVKLAEGWPEGVLEGTNIPRRTFQNTQAALLKIGASFWFDEFRQRMFVGGHPVQAFQGELNDRVCLYLRDMVNKRFRFDAGRDMIRDAVEQLCNQNVINPVEEYLASLTWDGQQRLDDWLTTYADADDSAYVRAVGAIALVAAVRRVRSPGTKFDTIPVLEGPQGTGKSTLIKILAGEDFFSDQDILALDHKAQMEALEGVWLYELCELAGMRFTEVNKIKAFASRSVDRARPAYARFSETRPRRGIFIGTTNDDQYLKDETGNRRFWPIRTGRIDLEGLKLNRDQLWAEAVLCEQRGDSIVLPKELWPAAAAEQLKRVEADGWEVLLETVRGRVFNGREQVGSQFLLTEALKIMPGQIGAFHYRRLSKAMKALGWEGPTTLTFADGAKLKGYWRPTDRPNEAYEPGI